MKYLIILACTLPALFSCTATNHRAMAGVTINLPKSPPGHTAIRPNLVLSDEGFKEAASGRKVLAPVRDAAQHKSGKTKTPPRSAHGNLILQYHNRDKTKIIRTNPKLSTDLGNRSVNPAVVLLIDEVMDQHVIDAIHVKSHQTRLIFEKGKGKIRGRTKANQKKSNALYGGSSGKHADSIQLIPENQFSGGILHNVAIVGFNSGEINTSGDQHQQGLFASDGRFENLIINGLDIHTQNKHGITIAGMFSGKIANINLSGGAEITLIPMRIAGDSNFYIASVQKGHGHRRHYKHIDISNVRGGRVNDYRHVENPVVRAKFIKTLNGKKFKIYSDFPVNRLLNAVKKWKRQNPKKGTRERIEFIRATCLMYEENGWAKVLASRYNTASRKQD